MAGAIVRLPEPDVTLARRLFDELDRHTRQGAGITRASYGDGEQFAHDLVVKTAREIGLDVSTDVAGNLYVTLRGRKDGSGTFLIASHLNSVPQGGNFDGAAGVLAGLAILASWKKGGFAPNFDVATMAIRAEESTWFPYSYIGSKAALGLLSAEALEVRRADTGHTLAQHIDALGFKSAAVRDRVARWKPDNLKGYVELHIEQGPVLEARNLPVALVTGIRGSFRYREARVFGEYGHSGAVPRAYRHDAVIAAADFVMGLDDKWQQLEREGRDLTVTIGKFFTDPEQHAFSKIAGDVGLCIDVRSHEQPTLAMVKSFTDDLAREIGEKYGVRFDLGILTGSEPAIMDPGMLETFDRTAVRLGIPHIRMASGAGHDAAVFAGAGVPTLMVFVRNQNGSHNPDEAMRMEDFDVAVRLIAHAIANLA